MLTALSCCSPVEERPSVGDAPAIEGRAEAEHNGKEKDIAALYSLEPATEAEFDKAATNYTVSFMMGRDDARKVNGTISLKINGEWKLIETLKDTLFNTDDTEMAAYTYLGQNKELNKYLVAGRFYEHHENYLIDKITGEIAATTWSEPAVSPDLSFLANVSLATTMDLTPNGIQVWKVTKNGTTTAIEKYFEINQQEWEAFEMQWESPRSIIIKIIAMKEYEMLKGEPKQEDFIYHRLKIK